AVTNLFNMGHFQGDVGAPIGGGVSTSRDVWKGGISRLPDEVLVDEMMWASYNTHGLNGCTFLIPVMWDLASCYHKTSV
ncbi:hypothetical protein KI387_015632, partial [Taxus chinensis]